MAYKKYALFIIAAVLLFAALNFVIWKTVTETILTKKFAGGDLARLGYLPGSKSERQNFVDLPKRHMNLADYKGGKVDMITMGDSFSHGGAGGRNPYYQDYIASFDNLSVLNISPYRELDAITTVSLFLNNGYLDRFNPRIILIEAAEKFCFTDMAKPVQFDLTIPQQVLDGYKKVDYYAEWPKMSFINSGNLNYLLYSLFYHLSDHAFFGTVYVGKLKQQMFTVSDPDRLLYFKYKKFASHDQLATLNDNLNKLAGRLKARGIALYFMPVADKYTLYDEYLLKNRYQPSSFFEEFRKLPKNYGFIDTKAILSEELKKGEKDIYFADDTHWSWKASEKIFSVVRFP